MKKNLVIKNIIFIILLLFSFNAISLKSYANSNYTTYVYARVEKPGVYLYKSTTSKEISNAYFEIPKSYFVLLISNINTTYYKAQYKDVVGYVLKDQVTPVAEKPKNPYPDKVKFWVYSTDGTNIIDSTFNISKANNVGSVQVTQELEYYGELLGEEFVKNRGYLWLYCKTENASGYLYKGLSDLSEPLKENLEVVTKIEEPFKDTDNSFLYNLVDMSVFLKIVLIILVTLPSVALIYLLFKPFNIKQDNVKLDKKPKNRFKRRKAKNSSINRIQKIIDDEQL